MDRWTRWTYELAPKYGLDPHAVDAISRSTEWPGRRGAGDAGTSFGPHQLHVGGALPRGKGRKWAESRAGLDYALRQMAKAGARGLTGHAAIAAIATNFERPADVGKEIRQSTAWYDAHPRGGVRRLAKQGSASVVGASVAVPQRENTAALQAYLLNFDPRNPTQGLVEMMSAQAQARQAAQAPAVAPQQALRGAQKAAKGKRLQSRGGYMGVIPEGYKHTMGGHHETSGLAGYPARDIFAAPGTPVTAPVNGRVIKLSGHDPRLGAVQGAGGPLGWSTYIEGEDGRIYFLTHQGRRNVKVGQQVQRGQVIGTVAKYGTSSHIHVGIHG